MPLTISRRSFLAASAVLLNSGMAWSADSFPSRLDHVIVGCDDLDRGIAFMRQRTGIAATPSGVHPGRGTRNALMSLGERHYLEILAPDLAQSITSPELTRLAEMKEPRLLGWAVHPGSIEEFAKRLRERKIEFAGPMDGSRKRPDGRLLRWRTLVLKDDRRGVLPFFIEWSADSVHPSVDAPHGCTLAGLQAQSPEPGVLKKIFQDLEIEIGVTAGSAEKLLARISGSTGTTELSS